MRQRKPTNLDKQLEELEAAIVANPADMRGKWKQTFLPDASEVRLDLGCGKGSFLLEAAKAEPQVLFVAIDMSETCIARTAKKILDNNLPNAKAVIANADDILEIFAPEELNRIYLNFNSPFPKARYAKRRLTHAPRLMQYRTLLAEGGVIDMRTDNMPYWKYSLEQFRIAGYDITHQTEDLHRDAGERIIESEYDRKTVSQGAVVYALLAVPGPAPKEIVQDVPQGLKDYLPQNLETLDRVPYGMEDTIYNLKAHQAKTKRRQEFLANRVSKPAKPAEAAFLLIDMQMGFIDKESPLCIDGALTSIPSCEKALRTARQLGMKIIHVRREYDDEGRTVELVRYKRWEQGKPLSSAWPESLLPPSELNELPGETVLYKPRFSAFFGTNLHERLQAAGIKTVVLAGTTTPNCIRSTAYDALSWDYNVVIIKDATSSNSSEIQRANLADMRNLGIQVITAEMLRTDGLSGIYDLTIYKGQIPHDTI